jgi:hypothetical protein
MPPAKRGGASHCYAAAHFGACPVGGVGRKRQLLDVAALLRFAVTRAGAPDRWLPPPGGEIETLIGHADRHHEDSTPIKPEQLAALLDALQQAGKEELHLAVPWWACSGFGQQSSVCCGSRRAGCTSAALSGMPGR